MLYGYSVVEIIEMAASAIEGERSALRHAAPLSACRPMQRRGEASVVYISLPPCYFC